MKNSHKKTKRQSYSCDKENNDAMNNIKEEAMIEELSSKGNYYECFIDNLTEAQVIKDDSPQNKYANRIQFPIIETIIIDNAQVVAWVFTDKSNYVMKRSKNKLNKDCILNYFLNLAKDYLKAANQNIFRSNEKIFEDINRFLSVNDIDVNGDSLLKYDYTAYLHSLYSLKYILITYNDPAIDKKKFANIFELIKCFNDYNKFGVIKLIQNTLLLRQNKPDKEGAIDFNKAFFQPFIIQYLYRNNNRKLNLFLLQRRSINSSNGTFIMSEDEQQQQHQPQVVIPPRRSSAASVVEHNPNTITEKIDYKSLLIPITNDSLMVCYTPMIHDFVKQIEKVKNVTITSGYFSFSKFNICLDTIESMSKNHSNTTYLFAGAFFLKGISHDNVLYKVNCVVKREAMRNIINKIIPKDIIEDKGNNIVLYKINKDKKCFGEFCDYEIPKMLKNIKNTTHMEKMLEEYTPQDNKFSMRDKTFHLPKKLPVFQLKQAHDNAKLVNMILTSYSIHSPQYQSLQNNYTGKKPDETNQYTPTPNKFDHLNYDTMYNPIGICYNCFQIYTLINNFIGGLDQSNNSTRQLNRSRSMLYRGVNFSNNYISNNNNEHAGRFNNEIKSIAAKQMIYNHMLFDVRLSTLKQIRQNDSNRIYKNRQKSLEESRRCFQYNINVNPKVLDWKTSTNHDIPPVRGNNKKVNPKGNATSEQKPTMKRCASSITTYKLHLGMRTRKYASDENSMFSMPNEDLVNKNPNMSHMTKTCEKSQATAEKEIEKKELDVDIIYRFIKLHGEENNVVGRFVIAKSETVIKPNLINTTKAALKNSKAILQDMPILALDAENLSKIEEESLPIENKAKSRGKRNSNAKMKLILESHTLDSLRINPENIKPRRIQSSKTPKIHRKIMMDSSDLPKSTEEKKEESRERLKNFVQMKHDILSNDDEKHDLEDEELRQLNMKEQEELIQDKKNKKKKKIQVSSVFYRKNYEHGNNPYYFLSTPIAKFNEANNSVTNNHFITTQSKITKEDYQQISTFDHAFILDSLIFVYDSHTAVPYKVVTIKSKNKRLKKGKNLSIFIINDFFESYTTYNKELTGFFSQFSTNEIFYCIRLIFFNLPGQTATLWSSKQILNNTFYCNFFDHFLYFLYKKEALDKTYKGIILGFGNGGHIGLTYLSNYNKFGDFFENIILVNSYLNNDNFLSQSMVEIQHMAFKEKNKKLIDFFLKSITYNSTVLSELKKENKLTETNDDKNIDKANNLSNNANNNTNMNNSLSLNGYSHISKGYFYNIEIDSMKINLPILFIHSTQNSFISIQNITNIIDKQKELVQGQPSSENAHTTEYDLSSLWKKVDEKDKDKNKDKRILIPIDCAHDLYCSTDIFILLDILSSYMKYYLDHSK